ncbi:hypothetical protein [Niallia taxi]|uniref:hypothetical protein n=1 Tax=Niallia taxi TaxID=2499688 RepID=UPI002E2239DF|nr:hypothetical protein [Niallia taxi]
MIGLIFSIILFNTIAFKYCTKLSNVQILNIWTFTIAFQNIFDIFVEIKYKGYWYFNQEVDWVGILAHTLLIPSVNMMFLNWYPYYEKKWTQFFYITLWVIGILVYEGLTLLPEPWGFFHYGWWKLRYSAIIDILLFLILLQFYKLIKRMEHLDKEKVKNK